jgi:hypothetical protein
MIIECEQSIFIDARALGWAKDCVAPDEVCQKRLRAVGFSQPPYSDRYPGLANILNDDIGVPKGNMVTRNVCFASPATGIHPLARKFGDVANNLSFDTDPGFENLNELNFKLKDDSLVYKQIPAFAKIPFDRIGLFISKNRKSLN